MMKIDFTHVGRFRPIFALKLQTAGAKVQEQANVAIRGGVADQDIVHDNVRGKVTTITFS
jgi:hypothetical protein